MPLLLTRRTLAVLAIAGFALPALLPLAADAAGTSQPAGVMVTQEMSGAGALGITSVTPVVLDPLTITNNSAVGSSQLVVTTSSATGYILTVKAADTPAMQAGTSTAFEDLATTTQTWAVSTNHYVFGFSAVGVDVYHSVYGTSTAIGTSTTACEGVKNTPSATLRWRGFQGNTQIEIASSSAPTTAGGNETILCVADAQNGVFAPTGSYVANITATATIL